MQLGDPRRKAVLNDAMDRIYAELTRTTPAQVVRAPVVEPSGVGLVRMNYPALQP